jgi:DNA primase large subunit
MDIISYSKYPFLQEASQYVKDKGYSVQEILSNRAFEVVRNRGKKRVLDAIAGDASKDDDSGQPEIELLSYPVARMLVSIPQDSYLVKRYAIWEAKRAYSFFLTEKTDVLLAVGKDFGITAKTDNKSFVLHFTDYLRYSSQMKDMSWKLINRKMIAGMVYVPRDSFARLLEEAVREKVQGGIPSKAPEEVSVPLQEPMKDVTAALNEMKGRMNVVTDGVISRDAFPPCMTHLLADLQHGVNLPHTARFALTSFLANIGLDKEKIMEQYRMAPDFREDLTRYQVEHITGGSGTEYTSPSCKTMLTYGNCYGKNRLCDWVTHPLIYYRKAAARQMKELQQSLVEKKPEAVSESKAEEKSP